MSDSVPAARPRCCKPACTREAIKVVEVEVPTAAGPETIEHAFCAQHGRGFLGELYDLAVGNRFSIVIQRRSEGKLKGGEAVGGPAGKAEEIGGLFPRRVYT